MAFLASISTHIMQHVFLHGIREGYKFIKEELFGASSAHYPPYIPDILLPKPDHIVVCCNEVRSILYLREPECNCVRCLALRLDPENKRLFTPALPAPADNMTK